MKPTLTLVLTVWTLLGAVSPVRGQDATPEFDPLGEHDNLPKMIRIQVEFIEVPHETLTELMGGEDAKSDLVLRKTLGNLVKEGKATIVETQMIMARSGQRATAESIEEFIYPTEYEPPELPSEIHITEGGEKIKSDGKDYATGPTPTAFETRNLGSTIEVEPMLAANNKLIELRIAPELVYHVRNQIWAEWNGTYGQSPIQMPIMYSIRTSLSVTLLDGEPALVAAVSPRSEEGFPDFERKLMIFVKADVLTVGR